MPQIIDHTHHAPHKGGALTQTQREVLDLIVKARQPATAYHLIDLLQKQRGKLVQPPTLYRAINFLVDNGYIHRLESMNAFIACSDCSHSHSSQFVICTVCGRTEELTDEGIATALSKRAAANGFSISQQIIELRGTCNLCGNTVR